MITSRDVARVADVSQSTVSYVMSGKRSISEKTRKRVEAAIEELTYHPHAGARALASQRTQVIGLVMPFGSGSDTTGLLPFIETITSCARERDYDVLLVTTDEGPSVLTRLAGRSLCDAIVLMDIEARDARIPVAASLRVPVILIGVPDDPAGLHCVDVDFTRAGVVAVEELAGTGHDRIVVIGQAPEVIARGINYIGRFERGVAEAAGATGVGVRLVAPVEPTREGARAAVEQVLAGDPLGGGGGPGGGPVGRLGMVVPNSAAIQFVLRALVERGLVPGRDVSVIGLCTDEAAVAMEPAVTNVSLQPREVSARAMAALFAVLESDAVAPPAGVDLVAPLLTRRETTLAHL